MSFEPRKAEDYAKLLIIIGILMSILYILIGIKLRFIVTNGQLVDFW